VQNQNKLVVFIIELQKSARLLLFSMMGLTALLFWLSSGLIETFQGHLQEELYFFSVAGPFLAHVRIAFFGALFLLMPLLTFFFWKAMGKPFGISGARLYWFVFATCLLFYAGTLFCYMVTLPFGVNFLLGFQSEDLRAVISIGKFVSFVTLFMLAFGIIFELPVFMIFCAYTGMISRRGFAKHRRLSILAIAIIASILTPTPDVVNMALMGGPLYLLYEAGILVIRILKIGEGDNLPVAGTTGHSGDG